jgi:DNA-binding HxlR family transcriptional regulator
MAVLQGALADRDTWSAVGECPIERTVEVVGTKSALLILREAYYGTTRFEDFCGRVGITKAAAAARLNELVEAGLLTRRPYREPGQRTREEYVLDWGQRHLPNPAPLRLAHAGCSAAVTVGMLCSNGHLVLPDELVVRLP